MWQRFDIPERDLNPPEYPSDNCDVGDHSPMADDPTECVYCGAKLEVE